MSNTKSCTLAKIARLFTLNKKAARQNTNTTPTPKCFVVPVIPDIEPTFTKTPTLGDFDVLKMIGKGASGKVFLVRNKATREIYSLKVVPKSGRFEDVIREQGLLRAIGEGGDTACFVLSLVASWHDTENYYLLTPFCGGGDVATHLLATKKFSIERARLYLAQSFLALESLQRLGIVHRDIKPANVFLDATGNIVLGDLGLGKRFSLEDRGPEPFHVVFNADPTATSGSFHFDSPTTNERCGTPAFMAPDQHHGRPYSYDVDVWGIGVSFFYILTGRSPWSGNPKTVDDYARIAGRRPHFKPDDGLDEETQDIIEWMLVPIREARPTVQELKKHTFFSSIDWAEVARGQVRPSDWTAPPMFVPRKGRPDLVVPGTSYDEGMDPLPGFAFVSPGFYPPPPKLWYSRLASLLAPKERNQSQPQPQPQPAPAPGPAPTPALAPAPAPTPTPAPAIAPAPTPSERASSSSEKPKRMVILHDAYPGFNFTASCPGCGESDPTSDEEGDREWVVTRILRRFFYRQRCATASPRSLAEKDAVPGAEDSSPFSPVAVLHPWAVKLDFPPPSKSRRAGWQSHTRRKEVVDGQMCPPYGFARWAHHVLKARLSLAAAC